MIDRERSIALLSGLVGIRSLSGEEGEAASWLTARARELGWDRAFVDDAGNAVAELGDESAPLVVVLLGHIDTVPGEIAVRIEEHDGREVLRGRGAVDAKGPLATFVAAGARLGADWARAHQLRLVVAGAVEEEAASSKGARFLASRFDGEREPVPAACVIGEPSRWDRVTIGYKGRLLVELEAVRSMTHSAGPEATAGTAAVGLWNQVEAYSTAWNTGRDKAFDQLLPSLRSIRTDSDGLEETAVATVGLRLPPDFDAAPLIATLERWAAHWVAGSTGPPPATSETDDPALATAAPGSADTPTPTTPPAPGATAEAIHAGTAGSIRLRYRAHEPAWRGDSRNPLVRSFLHAIRSQAEPGSRPAFLVKTGTSDMNVVGPAWRCPILAYGPGDSRLDHTPDEHIVLDEFWRAVLVLEQAMRDYASSLE